MICLDPPALMEGELNCTGGWGFQLPFVTSRRPEEHLELENLAPRGITDGVCWNILLPLRVSHNTGPLMCLFLFIFSFLLWCKITMMCEASSAGGTRSWATTRVLWRRWYVKGNITATSQLAAAMKAGDVTTTQKIKRVLVGGGGRDIQLASHPVYGRRLSRTGGLTCGWD